MLRPNFWFSIEVSVSWTHIQFLSDTDDHYDATADEQAPVQVYLNCYPGQKKWNM